MDTERQALLIRIIEEIWLCSGDRTGVVERIIYMEEKLKKLESELKAMGINSVDELNEAIKKEKLDISLMVAPIPVKEAIAS